MTISDIKKRELAKGIVGRYFHSESTTIGFVEIEKGSILPAHSHFHEQTTLVTEGKLEMNVDGVVQVLNPGSILRIPSNALHSALALTDCKVTDVFCPVREDYK